MNIPQWVEKGLRKKADRAAARLKYVFGVLAARHTSRNSVRGLAEMVCLDHSTISIYIRRGQFSERAANLIVRKLGEKDVTATMLTDPMSIPKEPG